jgi:hypothetical protein
MAKLSQKELLEEGFSDKIRGIAKAAAAGVKQAAQQGINLDTGKLVKGMTKSYKGEQPIAVLKKELANDPSIEIVKINKKGITKQQASGKKGYLGRIVGPKTVTLIPFQGVLYDKGTREYEGADAGTIKEARAAMGHGPGSRSKEGKYNPVSKKGSVKKQIIGSLVKSGVKEDSARDVTEYISKNMKGFLKYITEARPNIPEFTYKGKPELGVVDLPDEEQEEFSDYMKMGRVKFLESLDDEVIIELLKTLQEAQPGYEIEFTETKEKKEDTPSDYDEGMFVAEIFRTKDGLKLGDIYREGDPTAIIRGAKQPKKESKPKLSPFDVTIKTFKDKNSPITAATLAPALKINTETIVKITGRDESVKLQDDEIDKLKAGLIKQGVIKEGTNQKDLLRQLTLLSS